MLVSPFRKRYLLLHAAWLVAMMMLTACENSGRLGIRGTVTLDGQPLNDGYITLTPLRETGGPSTGAKIENGAYRIPATGGSFAGEFRVEIIAARKTGRQVTTQEGQPADEFEQYLPARYNKASDLTASVTLEGNNEFDFALDSQ